MLRTVEMFLFDTCTHKCAYCHFAETGKVLDASQTKPYRDPAFIDSVVSFFNERTTEDEKWLVTLTGGEPLLMPNLARFGSGLASKGNKLAFYTALLVGEKHPGFRFLMEEGSQCTDYIMASFHAEAEDIEDAFFERVRKLKSAGHSVIFRFVGHPDRLHRLDELSARCRDLDVAFHPTPLFSPAYPSAYTEEQRRKLDAHAISLSQVIQLEGGIDTSTSRCSAGSTIMSIDMRTGDITPCITVQSPKLGNIYDNTFKPMPRSISCPAKGVPCICDIHFQQSVVFGADDHEMFEAEKRGFVEPKNAKQLREIVTSHQLRFSADTPTIGQTETAGFVALDTAFVKGAFEHNKTFLHGGYSENNHPEFKRRQFESLKPLPPTLPPEPELIDPLPPPRSGFLERIAKAMSLR